MKRITSLDFRDISDELFEGIISVQGAKGFKTAKAAARFMMEDYNRLYNEMAHYRERYRCLSGAVADYLDNIRERDENVVQHAIVLDNLKNTI